MGFLLDFLIPALIIGGVAFIWLRTLFSRFLPGRTRGGGPQRRGMVGSPRSFMESGGAVPPVRQGVSHAREDSLELRVDLAHVEDRPARPVRDRREPAPAAGPSSARRIRRAIGGKESIRTAFLVKEVLEPPVSMRE